MTIDAYAAPAAHEFHKHITHTHTHPKQNKVLRHGMDAVAKWLAVRIVWWDMRAEWLELLYRHRVCNARMDFVEQRLGQVGG